MPISFSADENGYVLKRLQSRDDNLSVLRDIDFSVVFATESNAFSFAKQLAMLDVQLEVEHAEVVPGLPWDVTMTRHMIPGHAAIGHFETTLDSHASPLGGRHDGWGCFGQDAGPVHN